MSKKETYRDVVIRVDQSLKDLKESNESQHKEIITNVKELCAHVNHENDLMSARISKLEIEEIKAKTERKTIKIISAVTIGVLTIISITLDVLYSLHIIF